MILEMMSGFMENAVKELQEAQPAKREEFMQMALSLFQFSTQILKESPEFRRAFAAVHTEFFKYPESQPTISQIFKAEKEFVQN